MIQYPDSHRLIILLVARDSITIAMLSPDAAELAAGETCDEQETPAAM
jgi:hypothetical protein